MGTSSIGPEQLRALCVLLLLLLQRTAVRVVELRGLKAGVSQLQSTPAVVGSLVTRVGASGAGGTDRECGLPALQRSVMWHHGNIPGLHAAPGGRGRRHNLSVKRTDPSERLLSTTVAL
ncbi:unnamed protein product [Merluccius merluccius]